MVRIGDKFYAVKTVEVDGRVSKKGEVYNLQLSAVENPEEGIYVPYEYILLERFRYISPRQTIMLSIIRMAHVKGKVFAATTMRICKYFGLLQPMVDYSLRGMETDGYITIMRIGKTRMIWLNAEFIDELVAGLDPEKIGLLNVNDERVK